MFAFIFHCRSFSPGWPLAFLIFSPPLWISMFFFLRNSSPLFSITRSSSFSVIHVSVNIKIMPKKTRLFTRPSFQEETDIVLASVFPSSSNRPLVFKAHACTSGLSRDRFPVNSLAWGKISLTCCREPKVAFLSVGSVNVVVLLPLWEINNYFGRNI